MYFHNRDGYEFLPPENFHYINVKCALDRYFRLNLESYLGLRGLNSLESGGGFLLIASFFLCLVFLFFKATNIDGLS